MGSPPVVTHRVQHKLPPQALVPFLGLGFYNKTCARKFRGPFIGTGCNQLGAWDVPCLRVLCAVLLVRSSGTIRPRQRLLTRRMTWTMEHTE